MKKSVKVRSLGAALLGVGLLSGCTMQGPGNLKVHEVSFYGVSQDRLAWVYGTLSGGQGSLSIGGKTVTLRPQVSGPLATAGSLSVDGQTVYRAKSLGLLPLASVVQDGGSYAVSATQNLAATYLVTGGSWYKLSGALSAGTQVSASAEPLPGPSGVGNLTTAEAAALGRSLGGQGSLVVTLLLENELPDAPLSVTPAPGETLRTGLYLQPLSAITRNVTTTNGGSVSGTGSTSSTLNFREVASGSNAQISSAQAVLASNQRALDSLWKAAYARQVPVPPTPIISGQTAVGLFLGSRPTGGYAVTVQSVRASGSALSVTVNVRAPGPGTITTQSITSPWTIIAVQGQYSSVSVRDQNGQPLGN